MPPADPAAPPDRGAVDELFQALASEDRRHVLAYLQQTEDGSATVETLADSLRAEAADPAEVNAVAVRLHHTTLPKLAAVGLVEVDRERGRVEYRAHPFLEQLMAEVDGPESPA